MLTVPIDCSQASNKIHQALLEKKRSFYAEAIALGVWMDFGSDWDVRSHIVMRACDQNV